MKAPSRPIEVVFLDHAEHVGHPCVRIFVTLRRDEFHGFDVGADFADEERILRGEREELAMPVALPWIDVTGIHDAVSAPVTELEAFGDAGEVVAPVESAGDDEVLRASRAN